MSYDLTSAEDWPGLQTRIRSEMARGMDPTKPYSVVPALTFLCAELGGGDTIHIIQKNKRTGEWEKGRAKLEDAAALAGFILTGQIVGVKGHEVLLYTRNQIALTLSDGPERLQVVPAHAPQPGRQLTLVSLPRFLAWEFAPVRI